MTDADDDLTAPPLAGSGAEDSAPGSAPAPLREDMVQNAVAFLQHPQARALPSLPRPAGGAGVFAVLVVDVATIPAELGHDVEVEGGVCRQRTREDRRKG